MPDSLQSIDRSIFLFFNRDIANPVFDIFFVTITDGRFWILPIMIAAFFYIRAEQKKALAVLMLSLITIALSDPIAVRLIKPFVNRPRPCNPLALVEGGRFLLGYKTSLSFPSAHACNVFAQAMLFTLIHRRYWPCYYSIALLIAFSRVYVGVHYPADIIGGAVVGTTIGFLVYSSYRFIAARQHRDNRQ